MQLLLAEHISPGICKGTKYEKLKKKKQHDYDKSPTPNKSFMYQIHVQIS